MKVFILSMPRSGSSALTNLISSANFKLYGQEMLPPSDFNKDGYFEDKIFTLLNDQLIRMLFGLEYSFLHIPNFINSVYSDLNSISKINFSYDLDDIYIPPNYKENLFEYTGCSWDVWGLTRMQKGEKWYKAYSRSKLNTTELCIKKINEISSFINSFSGDLVIKDPRLALVFNLYNFIDSKIIIIKRNKLDTLESMRGHYGKNIFSRNYLPNSNLCSNHFNYKIKYQDFDFYWNNYNFLLNTISKMHDCLVIEYENLLNLESETLINLEKYLGATFDYSRIRKAP